MDELESRIADAMERRDLVAFPAIPDGRLARVSWPDDDVESFLDAAARVTALVYCETSIFDVAALELLTDKISGSVGSLTDEAEDALAAVRGHLGRRGAITLAFAANGILHEWRSEAPWLRAATELIESAAVVDEVTAYARDAHDARTYGAAAEQRTAWAHELAGHRKFLAAANDTERRAAAAAINADLGGLLADVRDNPYSPLTRLAVEIVENATAIAKSEVRPRIVRETADVLDDYARLLADTVTFRDATTKAERVQLARSWLVETTGVTTPTLVEQLQRRASEKLREPGQ